MVFGSCEVLVTVALLLKAPTASTVAVTVMVALVPFARLVSVHGKALPAQVKFALLTFVTVRFVSVSVTLKSVAVSGPLLVTVIVKLTLWPGLNGPTVVRVLVRDRSAIWGVTIVLA